jgi:hypothetical protein
VTRLIRVDLEVARRLAELAVDGDTPNETLRRFLGLSRTQLRYSNFKDKTLSSYGAEGPRYR